MGPRLSKSGLALLTYSFLVSITYFVASEVYPDAFDIVTLALKPTCVNRQMVTSVNKFILPQPRNVHIIANRGCDVFETFGENVICYQEDTLVPSLNATFVSMWFSTRVKDHPAQIDAKRIQQRSTWFFQQFMKLAAAAHIPGLSEYFVIFDSDMIALRPLTWFLPLNATSHLDDEKPRLPASAQQPYPAVRPVPGKSEDGCVNPHSFRMLVNVGGWLPKYGYMRTYELLTGRSIIYGHDNTSLVAHSTVVYKPYMAEFLESITMEKYRDITHGWILSIIDAVLDLQADTAPLNNRWRNIPLETNEVVMGFSEFWSYLSWVQDLYPCAFRQAAQRTWTRMPSQFPRTLSIAVKVDEKNYIDVCCPTADGIRATREHGLYFTGYELGHLRYCNYHHEAFHDGYAAWYQAT
ncbi:hypothetical protein Vretimale_7161 [Volvox reticuliferus]|uniref:Uncharacterized protein n=1 Tax=Volvox reticuliferus TaxID=1737510 RepID=A0A8J4G8Q4_9CHLO|nr:hypothetical protein Vretifemale_11085 [Volvox reticuliferus]GIM02243.1 hypothetical protein Vretimale_7161 [Volvox reticuliferus]